MKHWFFSRRPAVKVLLPLAFIVLLVAAGWTYFGGFHFGQIAVASVRPSGSLANLAKPAAGKNDPEAALIGILQLIEQSDFDTALKETDALIQAYPKFRLAYLIKGDLLMARAHPLAGFGDSANAPAERLADLREEVLARLHAYRNPPPENLIPRSLLQLQPDQKYAILIDTQSSRLYLFENDDGTPRLAMDFYVTQGKLGAEKSREGDKKTPIGVYYVTSSLSPKKIGDFYGDGAFPLNYPNEWDKRLGREGHGIWLHGTPPDTYSRPPKDSDGCVVVSNHDLGIIAKYLQIGLTPVIISNGMEWIAPDDWNKERKDLLGAIDDWRKDWEARDADRYAQHYSAQFQADGLDRQAWVEQKRKVNTGKSWIKVGTDNISLFRNPGNENLIVVNFTQNYQSSNLSNVMKKRQYWIKEDGHWHIIYEGAA